MNQFINLLIDAMKTPQNWVYVISGIVVGTLIGDSLAIPWIDTIWFTLAGAGLGFLVAEKIEEIKRSKNS